MKKIKELTKLILNPLRKKKTLYGLISLVISIFCIYEIQKRTGINGLDSDSFDKEIEINVNINCKQPVSYQDYYSFTNPYDFKFDGDLRGGVIIENLNPSSEMDTVEISIAIAHPTKYLKNNNRQIAPIITKRMEIQRILPTGEKNNYNKDFINVYNYKFNAPLRNRLHIDYLLGKIQKKISLDISTIRIRTLVSIINGYNKIDEMRNMRNINFNIPLTEEVSLISMKGQKFDKYYAEKSMNYFVEYDVINTNNIIQMDDTVFIELQNKAKKRNRNFELVIISIILGISISAFWQLIFDSFLKNK